ncbi:MAG: hypothetical protein EXR20_03525 [Bacteroidetes bacterium]|nr:hypothetical protein [Bacteroidota bacterium]
MSKHNSYFLLQALVIFASVLGVGCSTKRLANGEVLLKKVIIRCDNPAISKDDIYGYVKQKPNRKLLGLNTIHLLKRGSIGKKGLLTDGSGYPLYLIINNFANPKRELKRKIRRDERFAKKMLQYNGNSKGKKQNKEPKKHKTLGEFLMNIGEAPSLIDSNKTNRSVNQIVSYLNNKGYFGSTVDDTVIYPQLQKNRRQKAIQCYIIHPSQPYTLRSIAWDIKDEGIAIAIVSDTATEYCQIKRNMNYDFDSFEAERDRITKLLKNKGYYKFSKDYIRFSIDSTLGSHQADVQITINKQELKLNDSSFANVNHQQFTTRNIYIKSLFDLQQLREDKDISNYDTTLYRNLLFLRNKDSIYGTNIEKILKFKPYILEQRISFRKDIIFRQLDYETTYRQLTNLRVFRQVVIDPIEVGDNKLDMYIKLFPFSKQSYTAQFEGTTNSGSNLGIGGSVSYENNNLYGGAEILRLGIKGGTEVQQTINASSNSGNLGFNTIQIGADASLNIPREFFPFSLLVNKKKLPEKMTTQDRRTVFLSSFNYQSRSDYDRTLANVSYGYTFKYLKNGKISFFPIELNIVKVKPKAGLLELLQNPDPLLQYRFTDHLIQNLRITYILNKQKNNNGDILFLKIDGESSGLLLREFFELSNINPDANGSYEIAEIPFSHYIRLFADGRFNKAIGAYQRLVGRSVLGIGLPLSNYPTLPLEKSFYSGGANGIRAWEARTLGPGSYIIPSDQKYAQFGDIQLEYNLELRFRITKTLNGAAFIDGGNIWILKKDSSRPNADFSFKKMNFLNDLAFGPGLGLRYDLSFFIVRLDWAFKLRDPSYPIGERWYNPSQRKLSSNLNFGIGYPF